MVKQSQGYRAGVVPQPLEDTLPIHGVHLCAKRSLFNHSTVQCIWSRLFARILTEACESDLSAREFITIALAGLANTRSPESKGALLSINARQAWSFTANVVKPIQQIDKSYSAYGFSQFDHLSEMDGETINLVLQRIKTATRFTRGPRVIKVYDSEGGSPREITHDEWIEKRGDWIDDNDVWVGSLDPVFGWYARRTRN